MPWDGGVDWWFMLGGMKRNASLLRMAMPCTTAFKVRHSVFISVFFAMIVLTNGQLE
jgi:hypothetical protein